MTAPTPLPRNHRLLRAIAAVEDSAVLTEDLAARANTLGGMPALAELAGTLDDLKRVVGHMIAVVSAEILACDLVGGQDDPWPIPSGGQLVKRGGGKRTRFDTARLVSVYANRLTTFIEDEHDLVMISGEGETLPALPIVSEVVEWMVAATGAGTPSFTGWRATPAKELDIKLSDFSEWEHGPHYITVEGRHT